MSEINSTNNAQKQCMFIRLYTNVEYIIIYLNSKHNAEWFDNDESFYIILDKLKVKKKYKLVNLTLNFRLDNGHPWKLYNIVTYSCVKLICGF